MFSTQYRLVFGMLVLLLLISCDNAESTIENKDNNNKFNVLSSSSGLPEQQQTHSDGQVFNSSSAKKTEFQKMKNQENDNGNEYFNIKDGVNEKSVSEECPPGTSWSADYKRCQPIDMCAEFGECNL